MLSKRAHASSKCPRLSPPAHAPRHVKLLRPSINDDTLWVDTGRQTNNCVSSKHRAVPNVARHKKNFPSTVLHKQFFFMFVPTLPSTHTLVDMLPRKTWVAEPMVNYISPGSLSSQQAHSMSPAHSKTRSHSLNTPQANSN